MKENVLNLMWFILKTKYNGILILKVIIVLYHCTTIQVFYHKHSVSPCNLKRNKFRLPCNVLSFSIDIDSVLQGTSSVM